MGDWQVFKLGAKIWAAAVILVLLAAGMLVAGAYANSPYGSSVWANLGATLVLAVPLILVERLIERQLRLERKSRERDLGALGKRVEEVQTSVTNVRHRLDELSRITDQSVAGAREADLEELLRPVREMVEDPSSATVLGALEHAAQSSATTQDVFVPVHEAAVTIRLGAARGASEPHVDVAVLAKGQDVVPYSWYEAETVQDLFVNLDRMRRDLFGAGAPRINVVPVIGGLADTLELALRRRADAGGPDSLYPTLLERPTEHWLITTRDLRHVSEPAARIARSDLFTGELATEAGGLPADWHTDAPNRDELAYAWSEAVERYREGY